MKIKYCSGCNKRLPVNDFFRKKRIYKDKTYYDYRHICKKCSIEAQKKLSKEKTAKNIKYCKCGNRIYQKRFDKCPACNIPHRKELGKLWMRKKRNSKPYKRNALEWMSESHYKIYKAKKMFIYRRRNPEAIKRIQLKTYLKSRDNLTDSYVKRIIQNHTGAKFKVIPDDLVELQRVIIQLKRTLNKGEPQWNKQNQLSQ